MMYVKEVFEFIFIDIEVDSHHVHLDEAFTSFTSNLTVMVT